MYSTVELRPFQKNTVDAILSAFSAPGNPGIFAVADEVGLGKTYVCADVAFQLLQGKRGKSQIIYYIAPSIELLSQNLSSIQRYLQQRFKETNGDGVRVLAHISRLSQAQIHIHEREERVRATSRFEGRFIHIVGLSPRTSFQLRSTGQKTERAFLAALLGFGLWEESKKQINELFCCLTQAKKKEFFALVDYYSKSLNQDLLVIRNSLSKSGLIEEAFVKFSDSKAKRDYIARVRRAVADEWLKRVVPRCTVFDEWHKYKSICFESPKPGKAVPLIYRFLEMMRMHAGNSVGLDGSKMLLVSATPFAVQFDEKHEVPTVNESEDLRGLLQMFFGEKNFSKHYDRLLELQNAYLNAISNFMKAPRNEVQELNSAVVSARNSYEKELRKYCVRTERPKPDISVPDFPATWRGKGKSLTQLLDVFSGAPSSQIRSPVVSMWQDGHSFPNFQGYAVSDSGKFKDLRGQHWKVQFLDNEIVAKGLLNSSSDRLHNFEYPPLWIWPTSPFCKYLSFSEFKFVPDEVSRSSGFGKGYLRERQLKLKNEQTYSGSIIGRFPFNLSINRSDDDGDERSKKTISRNFHWIIFFPFLSWEYGFDSRLTKSEFENVIYGKDFKENTVTEIVLAIDRLVCERSESTLSPKEYQILKQRLESREGLVKNAADPKMHSGAIDYLRSMFVETRDILSVGRIIAESIREKQVNRAQLERLKTDQGQSPKRQLNDLEDKILGAAASVMHLFSLPDGQILKHRAEKLGVLVRGRKKRKWNTSVKFALWYSSKYDLKGTLCEYFSLLIGSGIQGKDVFSELRDVISLRSIRNGNRYVRAFHDRKVEDELGVKSGEKQVVQFQKSKEIGITTKGMRSAFNSPFPPYILVSTSIGQEGLDFHRYCEAVIHWSPPGSPSTLKQREGRIDRFRSLQNRRAQSKFHVCQESHNGLSPDFVVLGEDGARLNKPDRYVLFLPFTSQHATWERCLLRLYYNDVLIGTPDPQSAERRILSAAAHLSPKDRRERLASLEVLGVNLAPRRTKIP